MKSVLFALIVFLFSAANAQNTPDFIFNRGYNYLLIDKTKAIDLFTECLESDPDYLAAYHFRGIAYYKSGQYQKALADFNETIKRNKNIIIVHMYMGYTFQHLGQPDKALVAFASYSAKKEKLSALDYTVLANAKMNQGDTEGAIKSLEEAIRLDPNESQYYYQFLALFNMGQFDLALKKINKALEINDNFYGFYLHRGRTLALTGRPELALQDFSRALTLSSEVADAYYLRGTMLDTLDRHNEAISDFTEAIKLNPEDGTYYSKRGNAKFAAGNRNAACLDWTIAGKFGYYEDFNKIKTLCE